MSPQNSFLYNIEYSNSQQTMKIVLCGGSGQVGQILARHFTAKGDDVVVLSRRDDAKVGRMVYWDADTFGDWINEIDGCDVVINLAGRSVNCRYNEANRRLIMDSRTSSTRCVGQAIANAENPPRIWLQSSTATIYAHRFDAPNDEHSGILGDESDDVPETWKFSLGVAKAWEAALDQAPTSSTRKVAMRSAMVMSEDRDGIFDVLLTLVRRGLGGSVGDGKQYVSWIHGDDFCRAVEWTIAHDELEGAVNFAAPNPLPYRDFMRELRDAWGMKFGLPTTKWMIEIGTRAMQTESELVLKSRRVVPARLQESGFKFEYSMWREAARDLCEKRRTS